MEKCSTIRQYNRGYSQFSNDKLDLTADSLETQARRFEEVRFGEFGLCVFLVNADNEQEALDELVDYLDDSGTYPGYLARWNDEYLNELRADAIDQGHGEDDFVNDFYVGPLGNHGLYLSDPYQTL